MNISAVNDNFFECPSKCNKMNNNISADFERALSLTGYGKFHYLLAICSSICLIATGLQNGLNAYVLPSAQCDLDLTSTQMGYLNASFLIGGICSAFLWGVLGDLVGRRKILVITLLGDWIITLFAALSQSYIALVIFRYLNGFLIGGPGTLIYTYFAEFQPERVRTKGLCFVGISFTLAWLILPALAWVVMPLNIEIHYWGMLFNSWRLFILIISIPSFIAGVWIYFLPESPKFLMSRGDTKQALQILKEMYCKNTGESSDNFNVKFLTESTIVNQVVLQKTNNVKTVGRGRTLRLIKDAKDQMKRLYETPLISKTFLSCVLLFSNMFGYLGLGLWIPEILKRFKEFNALYPEEKITICELQNYFEDHQLPDILPSAIPINLNITKYNVDYGDFKSCENDMDPSVFINTFIMGACCIAGNLISAFLSGILNCKVLPITTMLIGCITACSIYWVDTQLQLLIIGSLFQASMATANIVINGAIVGIFPTSVNAMAVCTATLSGRLGAVVSNLVLGFLLDKSCETPLIIIVVTLIIGTICGFFIPSETKEKDESSEETVKESYRSFSDISVISKL